MSSIESDLPKSDISGAENDITFINSSSIAWTPDVNHKPPNELGYNLISWPNAQLAAMDGEQQCVVQDILSEIGAGGSGDNNYFYYCWNNGSYRFGIRININFQMLGMGDRPSWQVMWDHTPKSGTINWMANGDDPADQYAFTSIPGYMIVATPTSTHQSLSIRVVITPN